MSVDSYVPLSGVHEESTSCVASSGTGTGTGTGCVMSIALYLDTWLCNAQCLSYVFETVVVHSALYIHLELGKNALCTLNTGQNALSTGQKCTGLETVVVLVW